MTDPAHPASIPPADAGLAGLFAAHQAELLRFLRARCDAPHDAEDLLQELWLRVTTHHGGPVANGRAYLFRMANNLALDRLRARQRAMSRDRAWLVTQGHGDTPPEWRPDPAPDAEDALLAAQEIEGLTRAIASLPPGARRALVLHRLEGLAQGEVAATMGISRSGVEKHLALAMRHLRRILLPPHADDCGSPAGMASSPAQQTQYPRDEECPS